MLTISTLILTSDTNRASPLRGWRGRREEGRTKHQTSNNNRDQSRAEKVSWKYELPAMVDAVHL